MQTTTPAQGWHTAQWGTWGWLETIAKCVALVAGVIAFFNPFHPSTFLVGGRSKSFPLFLPVFLLFRVHAHTCRPLQPQGNDAHDVGLTNLCSRVGVLLVVVR